MEPESDESVEIGWIGSETQIFEKNMFWLKKKGNFFWNDILQKVILRKNITLK